MLMVDVLRSIGIPIAIRSFMVDYCDSQGRYFHKPFQTITPSGFQEKDIDLINRIRKELKQQGYDVCGIQEAIGEFDLGELEHVFNGGRWGECPVVPLYFDMELAMKDG